MTERRVITAAEMDGMTPAERAAAVEVSTLQSLDELPDAFRKRVESRAIELNERLRRQAST